jgi:TfoX/Sxy family transcriptional regulator of competence genes
MAYDTHLAERIDNILSSKKISHVTKKMMGGLCYMVEDKMCFGIVKDQLMARIGPERYAEALKHEGVDEMNFTGRTMKGYVFVNSMAIDFDEALEYWIELCLAFNPLAKSSKKKK